MTSASSRAQSLFPHTKLDWTIGRLREQSERNPDDPALRIALARAVLGRGLFHSGLPSGLPSGRSSGPPSGSAGKPARGGTGATSSGARRSGEKDCNEALALVRKSLQEDPANAEALVLAGLALVGMERAGAAARYLDQAVRIDGERADLRLSMGLLARLQGDPGAAVRQLEMACRLAADAWETHLELGRTLMVLAHRQGHPQRLVERAQYHLVQALRREPPPAQIGPLLKDLGVSCLLTGRYREAEKLFIRLREHERYAPAAWFHLGLVAYELGKYNNAIQHFRQYLRKRPDDAAVLARMAMAWFQMGEYPRAREACHQALLADPDNVPARHALGCTLLEEGDPNEALKMFREALRDNPGHMPSYIEMVRTRRLGGDVRWLTQALEAEVRGYDQLSPGARVDARALTRTRVAAILDELAALGQDAASIMLRTLPLTQDEALRFQLWEAACAVSQKVVSDGTCGRLREPARWFGPGLGGMTLCVAGAVPEQYMMTGLQLDESDLKRAAVDRHGPAHDVQSHRRNLEKERARARAYQALLLLSIGVRRSSAGRELLRSWAMTADGDLALTAWVALALYGDPEAAELLRRESTGRNAAPIVNRLLAEVTPPVRIREARRVSSAEETRCSTCGRTHDEVTHMVAGGDTVMCDLCVIRVTQNRATLRAADDATCSLCGRSHFEAAGLYAYNGVNICNTCVQLSLGLREREEVDGFLAAW